MENDIEYTIGIMETLGRTIENCTTEEVRELLEKVLSTHIDNITILRCVLIVVKHLRYDPTTVDIISEIVERVEFLLGHKLQ